MSGTPSQVDPSQFMGEVHGGSGSESSAALASPRQASAPAGNASVIQRGLPTDGTEPTPATCRGQRGSDETPLNVQLLSPVHGPPKVC